MRGVLKFYEKCCITEEYLWRVYLPVAKRRKKKKGRRIEIMKERRIVISTIDIVLAIIVLVSVKAKIDESWMYTWEPPYSSYEQKVLGLGLIGIIMLASGIVGLFTALRQSKREQELEQRTGGVKNCPNCGLSISGYVRLCPRCGVDVVTGGWKAPIQNQPRPDVTAQNVSEPDVPVQDASAQASPAQKIAPQAPEEEETVVLETASDKAGKTVPENKAVCFCTKCGSRVGKDDLFCARCGNQIKRGEEGI